MQQSIRVLQSLSILSIVLLFTASQCNSATTDVPQTTPVQNDAVQRLSLTIVERYPHRSDSFTQGLLWHDGYLYESDGLSAPYGGQSSLRRVELATGIVKEIHHVAPEYFAEGLTRVNHELIQLTWQAGKAFVYDLESFELKRTIAYDGEGWGICFDSNALYMSDGSATLFKRNATSFAIEKEIAVTLDDQPMARLNELECVGDHVYANIWQTNTIVRINKQTGKVDSVLDASTLLEEATQEADGAKIDVLNGIAYDASTQAFYLTGKLWPSLFKVTW